MNRDMIDSNELLADPQNRAIWNAARREHLHVDVDRAWAELSDAIVGSPIVCRDAGYPLAGELRPFVPARYKYVGVPLAIAAALLIGFFAIKQIPNVFNTTQQTPTTKTYTTTPAQRANIILADGTRATLAPSTTINVTGRTVDLTGEAVFTVTQRNETPFTVRAGNTTTRVLGTSFAVRKYPDETQTRVIVSEGKVQVATQVLSAGQGVSADTTGQLTMLSDADVTAGLAWTGGRLVFQDTPIHEALAQIGRWYDVEFRIADSTVLARSSVTATLQIGAPTEVVLRDLAAVLDARVIRQGRIITLQ